MFVRTVALELHVDNNIEKMTDDKEQLRKDMEKALKGGAGHAVSRAALALLSGVIPFVGGAFGAASGAWSEAEQRRFNKIFASWLKLQEEEIKEIGLTLAEVIVRSGLTPKNCTSIN